MVAPGLTVVATSALIVAAAFAVTNWWSVTVGRRQVEWVTKPATMVFLLVAAIALHPTQGDVRAWMLVGLVLSLAGDVFLMLPRERFVPGLVSFLLGHIAYIVALLLDRSSLVLLGVGLVVVLLAVAGIGRVVVDEVHRGDDVAFTGPVVAYLTVISVMVVAAFGSANGWAIAGAVLFYVSDGLLAWNKFVAKFTGARPAIMSTYHLAQFGLVVSLVV